MTSAPSNATRFYSFGELAVAVGLATRSWRLRYLLSTHGIKPVGQVGGANVFTDCELAQVKAALAAQPQEAAAT